MSAFQELNLATEDMVNQNRLYQPSNFWNNASKQITQELTINGIEKFRSLETTLGYFVPTYGVPGNCFTQEMTKILIEKLSHSFPLDIKPKLALEQFLSGYVSALADFRVFVAADKQKRLPFLHTFSESNFGEPVEQFELEGRMFSRSSLNYLLGLTLLKKHLKGFIPKTVMEIGGGFGTLGEILSFSGIKDCKYIDFDIPPTSFVAQKYLCSVFGEKNVTTYKQTRHKMRINITELKPASVFCSWQIERLYGKIDLFVNFISFQEMEPDIVKNYLNHVDRLSVKWILLRNIREGKNKIKKGCSEGVEIPIRSDDYLTMLPSYDLIERNVIPYGFKTVDNFHSELLLLKRKS